MWLHVFTAPTMGLWLSRNMWSLYHQEKQWTKLRWLSYRKMPLHLKARQRRRAGGRERERESHWLLKGRNKWVQINIARMCEILRLFDVWTGSQGNRLRPDPEPSQASPPLPPSLFAPPSPQPRIKHHLVFLCMLEERDHSGMDALALRVALMVVQVGAGEERVGGAGWFTHGEQHPEMAGLLQNAMRLYFSKVSWEYENIYI